MRRVTIAAILVLVIASSASGASQATKPTLGVTGNVARFQTQTAQKSLVVEAFLAWGQGQTFGAPWQVLFNSLQPVPMIHIGTNRKGSTTKAAISTAQIAQGKGDGYLVSLNQAISQWGRAIYVRPMGEMNNPGNPWHGDPPNYRKAFARIFLIVHGGPSVNAKLKALGMPPVAGSLATNPFPRVRVLWSPLAGGDDPAQYWPGDRYVDVGGGDIYQEDHQAPPWQKFTDIYKFVVAHGKPFGIPEWGLFGVDVPQFVNDMCRFLKTHSTETEEFFQSKPGSIFDLAPKPQSRAAYKSCITPLAGALPPWAAGGPGSATQAALKLTPAPPSGDAPLTVTYSITAKLSVPVAHWQLTFGDGAMASGDGPPPATFNHVYGLDGTYSAWLAVFPSPPYSPTAAKFVTRATVTVGTGGLGIRFDPRPASGKAPLKVVFLIEAKLPKPVQSWQITFGDGLSNARSGAAPHFAGHTYSKPGTYRAQLILIAGGGEFISTATIHVS